MVRVFILLFLPMALWVLYSWSLEPFSYGSWELKKIDKIELIRLLNEESVKPVVVCEYNETKVSELNTTQELVTDVNQTLNEKNNSKVDLTSQKNLLVESNVSLNEANVSCKTLSSNEGKERIFVFGDSMGEGIAMGLSRLKKEFNFTYRSIAKCSTTTQYWLNYALLEEQISAYKPTVIFIVLGTNEWNNVTSATMVRMIKLRKRLEPLGIEIRWITPPVADSKKFYDVVHDVFGESVYDSRLIQIPRGEDHVHSTPHGYEIWSRHILMSLNVPRRSSR